MKRIGIAVAALAAAGLGVVLYLHLAPPNVRVEAIEAAGRRSKFAFSVASPRAFPRLAKERKLGWSGGPVDAPGSARWPEGAEVKVADLIVTAETAPAEVQEALRSELEGAARAAGASSYSTTVKGTTTTRFELVAVSPTGTARAWIVRAAGNVPTGPLEPNHFLTVTWTDLSASLTAEEAIVSAAETLARGASQ